MGIDFQFQGVASMVNSPAKTDAATKGDSQDVVVGEQCLSPEDWQRVQEIAESIDISDSHTLTHYGEEAQQKVSQLADGVLMCAADGNAGNIGGLLDKMYAAIKEFSRKTESKFSNFFGSPKARSQKLNDQYLKALDIVDDVKRQLTGYHDESTVNSGTLDRMYENSLEWCATLYIYILAGERALEALRLKVQQSGSQPSIIGCTSLQDNCDSFEQQLHNLRIVREIGLQSSLQFRMMRESNDNMIRAVSQSLHVTIPAWEQNMASVFISNSNKILAESQGMVNVAGILSGNKELLDAINETTRICEEGRKIQDEIEQKVRTAKK